MSTPASLARPASLLGAMALGGALVGFFLQLLVAYYFGAGGATDAFFMASSISELAAKLLMGGSVTAVFVPMFVQYISAGNRERAWQLGLNITHLLAFAFALLLIIIGFFARSFVEIIAPGFNEATRELTVQLLYVLLPSFLFLFLVDVLVAVLQALQQFTIPALLRLLSPGISIISVVVLQHSLGIYALAVGVVAGSALQLLLVGAGLRQRGLTYRPFISPAHPDVRRLLYLVYPFVLSMIVTQLAGITYRVLVSELLPGSLSALKYAEKITQLLTIIFINSVTTVIYPRLAHQVRRGDLPGLVNTLSYAMRVTLLLTFPLSLGTMLLREPLIHFIYEHGSFTPQASGLTSTALLFLSINLVTSAVSSILAQAVLALQRTRAAVAVTIVSQAVAIGLFVLLVPHLQLAGLALASSLVPISSALLYFIHLYPLLPQAHKIFWQPALGKSIVLAGLLAAVLAVWQRLVPVGTGVIGQTLTELLLPAATASFVFGGAAYWWRVPEIYDGLRLLRRTLRKSYSG